MKWMNSRKGSWTWFAGIIFAIMVLFSMSSCTALASTKPLATIDTPVPVTTIASEPTDTSVPVTAVTPASNVISIITSPPPVTDISTRSYPVPTLVNPAYGATIGGEKNTNFSWHWDGVLQEEEKYELLIWRPEKPPSSIAMPSKCDYLLDTPPDGFGPYLWKVAVVRVDKESGNATTLSESLVWPFVWNDVPLTPTPTPINTPTPTSTYTPIPEAVVVWEGGLNLRSGPGIIYDIIGFLSKDEILDIEGRIASNEWIKIVSVTNPDKLGWASALPQYVQINVDSDSIPIVEVPSTPTPRSTPTATPTQTPVLLPAPIPKSPLTEENARQIQTVEVRWEWTGRSLVGDEMFSVNIEPQGFECPAGHPHTQTKDTTLRAEMNCPSGRYAWYVKLVVPDNTSATGWRELSYPSPSQYFDFASPDDEGGRGKGGKPCVPPLCPK